MAAIRRFGSRGAAALLEKCWWPISPTAATPVRWRGRSARPRAEICSRSFPRRPTPRNTGPWSTRRKRRSKPGCAPRSKNPVGDLSQYDVIFVGSPCWWATIAPPVATFLSSCDLAGKTVVPFMTHEGSGMGHSEADIRRLCPRSTVPDGLAVRGSAVRNSKDEVGRWVRARLKNGF